MSKKSYKERRLARKAREQQKKDNLKTSEEARKERVQALGDAVITQKWQAGKGNRDTWARKRAIYIVT